MGGMGGMGGAGGMGGMGGMQAPPPPAVSGTNIFIIRRHQCIYST